MTQAQKSNSSKPRPSAITKEPSAEPRYEHGVTKLTYALKAWSVERRGAGWFVAETVASILGNKPVWRGPFQSVENACRAIARGLALELTDRHTRSVESHRIAKTDHLHGLDPKNTL